MPDIMTSPKLGRRTLKISGDLLLQMLAPGKHSAYTVIRDGMPEDARVVDVRWDGRDEAMTFYIVSAAFSSDHLTDYDQEIRPVLETIGEGN